MKIDAIILSRLDSNRLPGKALRRIDGKPLIQYVVDLCYQIKGVSDILIATSDREVDDPLEEFAHSARVPCFRGSCDHVAERFLKAQEYFESDGAVRINGDSPLNDIDVLSRGVELFSQRQFDMVTNVQKRTFPYGMSLEVVSAQAMGKAVREMILDVHKEHVTKYFYDHPENFNIHNIEAENPEFHGIQLAVDTPEDFDKFVWLVEKLDHPVYRNSVEKIVEISKKYNPDE